MTLLLYVVSHLATHPCRWHGVGNDNAKVMFFLLLRKKIVLKIYKNERKSRILQNIALHFAVFLKKSL